MVRTAVLLKGIRAVGAGGVPLPVKPLSERRLRASLFAILRSTPLCSLATVGPGRRAHSSHVYYAFSPTLGLYFLSDPQSGHCRHIATNPSMAVSVYDSGQRWGGADRGVALDGTCREARGRERIRAGRLYGARFPAYARWLRTVRSGDEAAKWRFFRFVARRVKVLDETRLGSGVLWLASTFVSRSRAK